MTDESGLTTVRSVSLPAARIPDRAGRWYRTASLLALHAAPLIFAGLVIATYIEPSLSGQQDNPDLRPIDGWWLLAGLGAANALAFRRWYPLSSMAAVTVAVTFVGATSYTLSPIAWMLYVSAFALGRYSKARNALFGLAWFTVSVVITWFSDQGLTAVDVAFVYAFAAMSWLAGRELSRWRALESQARADADRRVELERQTVELAVTQQRLHMAQELHDVVAHSLGVIAVQAAMADAAFESRPDESRQAVQNIARTSRASLTEIRRILGVLRDNGLGTTPTGGVAPRLADLPRLIGAAEASGLTVDSTIAAPDDLPPNLQLSAYRVIQQALTNVIEHADARTVTLSVVGENDVLEIDVVDDGRGAGDSASGGVRRGRGFGLVGMRERVATYGGHLDAGARSEGGFRVHATIPYDAPTDSGAHR